MTGVRGIHGQRPAIQMVRDRVTALERAGTAGDRGRSNARSAGPIQMRGTDHPQAVLYRFAARTFSVGRIAGGYQFLAEPGELRQRTAEWLLPGVPRDACRRRRSRTSANASVLRAILSGRRVPALVG